MFLSSEKNNTNERGSAELDALLCGISKGDQKDFEQFYLRTRSSVYSFALSILKNAFDAEDVLHDCYVLVWNNAPWYRSQGKPLAWLMTITRNLSLQHLRERQRRSDAPEEEWLRDLSDERGLSLEDRTILSSCLEALSPQEQQIVTLHAVAGFKHREIAELLELPLATVLSKYSRAMKRLKKQLQ
jgi:RNA polymerase sigma-70 factor (ECF subfamily)